MEDRQLNSSDCAKDGGKCCGGGITPFLVGLVVSLIFGWWVFPDMMYSKKEQPIRFSHKVHMESAGMECKQCHVLREDGTFAGLPSTASCADCHSDVLGSDPEEARFVNEYVKTGKEVKWLVYQIQPDNVFFSHAAHSLDGCNQCHDFKESELCAQCHPDVANSDSAPTYFENKLTGYSKQTMKMWQCERCHANENHYGVTNSSNACFVCHK
ncbi:menaquinone reductase multiheme cytochrome c subunit QrcA [Nitratidesulfovibrio sp. SRB-5]|uniref:menaquinone reductase multiheme cytochrome c subunit QrcA n=1 Tax=Nitratidesulfovibrio sp. SRB-5 TaxID=2872636 RepID=UPI001024CEFD|nr:menaquinone reductase multiheme cytochrome c subunit QrcA [Nitratidesulfovibrio sp. SRB-5]MBZ2170869.1 cytochrome c family protein [Nitratidesulfovibrio sp. SRB-5]RXF78132.1 cytochrome C [Desulfovibrio sp. DS-1]